MFCSDFIKMPDAKLSVFLQIEQQTLQICGFGNFCRDAEVVQNRLPVFVIKPIKLVGRRCTVVKIIRKLFERKFFQRCNRFLK